MATPFGEAQDLAAIYQIKNEGCEYRAICPRDTEVIPDVP